VAVPWLRGILLADIVSVHVVGIDR